MKKITGLGGVTEKYPTGRNVAEQELWVAVYLFEESAKLKWVNWVPGFEELKKQIDELTKEMSKLQGELWTLQEGREKILSLQRRMVEAFQSFMERALTIGKGSLAIARLVDPTIGSRATEAEIQRRIKSDEFRWSLVAYVEKMTDTTFGKIAKAVSEAHSTDLAADFGKFEQLRKNFAWKKDELETLKSDINTKKWEIQEVQVKKWGIEGTTTNSSLSMKNLKKEKVPQI